MVESDDVQPSTGLTPTKRTPRVLRPHTRQLDRGHTRLEIIQALAAGETLTSIALRHGCEASAIHKFRERHIAEIEAQRNNIADKMAALWVASKEKRIAEYESDVDRLNATLDAPPVEGEEPTAPALAPALESLLLSAKHRALRSVAEELGHLPTRASTSVTVAAVSYTLIGVDPEEV